MVFDSGSIVTMDDHIRVRGNSGKINLKIKGTLKTTVMKFLAVYAGEGEVQTGAIPEAELCLAAGTPPPRVGVYQNGVQPPPGRRPGKNF